MRSILARVLDPSPDREPSMTDREHALRRAEADAASVENQLATETTTLRTAADELEARLQQVRAATARLEGLSTRTFLELKQRLMHARVPTLEIERFQEQALAAREAAVRARVQANEAIHQALKAHAAGLSKVSSQLRQDEGALDELARQAAEEAERKAAPPPPEPEPFIAPAPKLKAVAPPKRQSARVRMQAAIDLHSDSNFFSGFSTNLGDGGIFVATVESVPHGTEVDLHFSLPTGERIDVTGVVRWSREVNDRAPDIFPGVGIQFVDLSPEAATAIHRFVASREPLFFPD